MGFFKTLGDIAEMALSRTRKNHKTLKDEMAVAPDKRCSRKCVSNAFGLETPEEKREREHDREVEKKELELKILRERNRKKK